MSDPGVFSLRLEIDAPAEVADGAGGVNRSYVPAGKVWAGVTPVSARFATEGDASAATITHLIRVRAPSAITTRHRLRLGLRIWRIVTVREEYVGGRYLVIEAQERRD